MADTKYYLDFHFPLKVVNFILQLIFGKKSPDNTAVDPGNREWFSQPRHGTDTGTEVVTTRFKLPLSVSEISMEVLRQPCVAEVWYQDRSNNWRPVLDMVRFPVRIPVSRSDAKSYYKFNTKVYPIVAKQLQFRLQRTNDRTMEDIPYPVGLRNCLIRRNVYDRSQGTQYFEEEQDVLGNVISKYIKDWDAPKAIDDDPYTFWKSAPMPDPLAVASLYLDLRTDDNTPRTIDKFYIDPVYTGNHLNLYYSNDDTVGTLKLSPITIRADEDENTDWRIGRGRRDVSVGVANAFYRWSMAIGPLLSQNMWLGVEWTPDFDPGDGPAVNPVLLRSMLPDPDVPGVFRPTLEYDVGAGEFTLQFDDGTETFSYSAPMSAAFTPNDPLRIVAGWRYAPDTVYINVVDRRGDVVASFEDDVANLPAKISIDGQLEMADFAGLVTATVIKREDYRANSTSFQASPTYYVDPDPVLPDTSGNIPSTTLDNAVYAASWVAQEHGSGGNHETGYEDKEWTPVWRNFVTEKGMLFLPQAISAKFWKFEFTNLTEQPYPIYESGIETRYKVFPIAVTQQASMGPRLYTGEGGFLGLGTFISVNGVRSVNFLNPLSVLAAVGSVIGPNYEPVAVNQGGSYITDTLPNQSGARFVDEDFRLELGSTYVYKREALQPYILAENAYVTTIKAEGLQKLAELGDVPWEDIEAANPGAITHVRSTGALPVRGTDWWIYPGQQLKVPASVMQRLASSETITERKLTLERRVRFNTTAVHRYDYKTLKRDAAIAYFAGVREIIPFTSTFITGEDKPYFDFPSYDPDQFLVINGQQLPEGPTTVGGRDFRIDNPGFDGSLLHWAPSSGSAALWTHDPDEGRWKLGSAHVTPDGVARSLLTNKFDVAEGDDLSTSVWVKWSDLVVSDTDWGPFSALMFYDNTGTYMAGTEIAHAPALYADWSAHTDSDWVQLEGTGVVPAGAVMARFIVGTTVETTAGDVWFDSANVFYTDPEDRYAQVFKTVTTASDFIKVAVDFKDSGLWRGDSMWADIDEQTESIDDTKLAPYVSLVPSTIPGGAWGDTTKGWGGEDIEWGSPFGLVSITLDSDRRRDGKRVLHFRRAAGAGEAGIKVRQWTRFVPMGLFRIGAVFYKPFANDNEITVRLRRISDGVIIHEETVPAPHGRWHEFKTDFVELPDLPDQEYEVIFTMEGDDEDELYLNDLYTEIAHVRYFVTLGGVDGYQHDVTDLRYVDGRAIVTSPEPVDTVSLEVWILHNDAWAYGARLTPSYLK